MAQQHAHVGRRHTQAIGHSVGQRGLVALSCGAQANRRVDGTRGFDAYPRRLVSRASDAGRFVELGAVGGGLDHVANANAQPAALGTGLHLTLAQTVVTDRGEHAVHGGVR
ncbi:hypothetical protein FQZ97_796890 [compost metagenome]